jgi:hypothetical protein
MTPGRDECSCRLLAERQDWGSCSDEGRTLGIERANLGQKQILCVENAVVPAVLRSVRSVNPGRILGRERKVAKARFLIEPSVPDSVEALSCDV